MMTKLQAMVKPGVRRFDHVAALLFAAPEPGFSKPRAST